MSPPRHNSRRRKEEGGTASEREGLLERMSMQVVAQARVGVSRFARILYLYERTLHVPVQFDPQTDCVFAAAASVHLSPLPQDCSVRRPADGIIGAVKIVSGKDGCGSLQNIFQHVRKLRKLSRWNKEESFAVDLVRGQRAFACTRRRKDISSCGGGSGGSRRFRIRETAARDRFYSRGDARALV